MNTPENTPSTAFLKLVRSDAVDALLQYPNCFAVLTLAAVRARREVAVFNPNGLEVGEAMMGDFAAVGLSRQEFRTALSNLQKWGFVTTRSTNKGTIVKLVNSSIYDINTEAGNHPANQQTTSGQPANNQRVTTKKKERKKEGKDVAADAAGDGASLHQQFTRFYSDWYLARNGVRPAIDGGDGKAVKMLSQHLKAQSKAKDDAGALAGLKYMLENWDKIPDPFYRKQQDLKQIAANVNNLLAALSALKAAKPAVTAHVGTGVGGRPASTMTVADRDALFAPAEFRSEVEESRLPYGGSTLKVG